MIRKGKISSIDGNGYRVESVDVPGDITGPLKASGSYKKGDIVVYVVFEDQSGMILGKM